jgi:hypothetical protein
MTDTFDLDSMLADILDDSKPLPSNKPAIITAPQPGKLPEPLTPDSTAEVTVTVEEGPPQTLDDIFNETEDKALNSLLEPVQERQTDAFPVPMPEAPQPAVAAPVDTTDYTLPPIPMPTFTNDEIAAALDLRNFATMTTLNTKRWHARVKDRIVGQDIADANDADASAFETRKKLLAGADELLKAIHKAIDDARAKYYEMTLPWTTTGIEDVGRRSGARIMPNTQFFEFVTAMGDCKARMEAALDKFVPAYPMLIQEARKKLGKRFDITEYPHEAVIRSHFALSFDFQPIPQGHDFKGLPDAQCQALANALQSKTAKMVENAMQDLWVRAGEAIGRMAERLSHPDKLFHYTLVENVRTVSNQLKHLNVTGDPRIRDLQQYVETYLCKHEVDELRKNPTLRATVGAHAQSAIDKMQAIARGH